MNTLKMMLYTSFCTIFYSLSLIANADTTCIVPNLSAAAMRESGDAALVSANCSTNDYLKYESDFHIKSSDWQGLGFNGACDRPNYPLQRFYAATRLLDKERMPPITSETLDAYYNWSRALRKPVPRCVKNNAAASTFSNRVEFYWSFFYNMSVIERAATIIHERTHNDKPHLSGDVTIIGSNACTFDLSGCDPDWDFLGAWRREVVWLAWYAHEGGVVNTANGRNTRQLAADIANWDIGNAFVKTPTSGGSVMFISCRSC